MSDDAAYLRRDVDELRDEVFGIHGQPGLKTKVERQDMSLASIKLRHDNEDANEKSKAAFSAKVKAGIIVAIAAAILLQTWQFMTTRVQSELINKAVIQMNDATKKIDAADAHKGE